MRAKIENRLDHFKSIRNNFIKFFEKSFLILNMVVLLLAFLTLFNQLTIVDHDIWQSA